MKRSLQKLGAMFFPEKELKKNGIYLLEWMLLAVVFLFSFVIFYYSDFSDTLDNSVMLAECILDGNFLDYYQYAAKNMQAETVYSANYNVFLYAVFAIWNLPTVMIHRMTGFRYMHSLFTLLWCKLLVLTATLLVSVMIRKILRYMSCVL